MPETSSPARHFDHIDALRGYAILMVIAVHASQSFPDLPNSLAKILSQGARGVQLFFVTSALTLSMSWVARNEALLTSTRGMGGALVPSSRGGNDLLGGYSG
jgi:peptidoglycan/LPS O-acetylase OafA/YrhL